MDILFESTTSTASSARDCNMQSPPITTDFVEFREYLTSMLQQPDSRCTPMKQPNDRGGRPFPYIQTKTRWRKRPTDELKYLRAQVIELEKLVARLSHSDTRTLTNCEMPLADNEAKELRKLQDESQARRMDFALAENRKLRAMIVSQLHLSRSLQAAIKEHTQLRARKLTWPTIAAASDGLLFTLLDQEKEYQYAALDKVLEESGVAQINHSLYSSLLLHRDPSGVSFQHNEVRMLPFAVSDVARSMRFSMSHGARVGPTEHCREIQMFGNYFHAVTVDTIEVPEAPPAEVHSRVLQLCVTQPKRTVVSWSGYVEYRGATSIRLLEKTWIVLEPISMEKLGLFTMGNKSQGTLMRVVVRLTPVETENGPQNAEDVEKMADVVVRTYQRKGQRLFQAMLEQLKR